VPGLPLPRPLPAHPRPPRPGAPREAVTEPASAATSSATTQVLCLRPAAPPPGPPSAPILVSSSSARRRPNLTCCGALRTPEAALMWTPPLTHPRDPGGSPAGEAAPPDPEAPLSPPGVTSIALGLSVEVHAHPRFERPLQVQVREARLLNDRPWVRS